MNKLFVLKKITVAIVIVVLFVFNPLNSDGQIKPTNLLKISLITSTISYDEKEQQYKKEIETALQKYSEFVRKVDGDAIADMFTEDGEIANPGASIKGREEIRKFLNSFKNVTVELNVNTTESITIDGETAVQTGTYKQRAKLADGKVVEVEGHFKAEWIHQENKWLLTRMGTKQ